jgi:hypothetical protein
MATLGRGCRDVQAMAADVEIRRSGRPLGNRQIQAALVDGRLAQW